MQAVIVTDAQRRGAIVTNEQNLIDQRETNQRSECCASPVIHEGLHTICAHCGNWCSIR